MLLVIGGAAVGVTAAWLIATRFITPEEAAESREPPAPDPIVAQVEYGRLREVVQLESTVESRTVVPIEAWAPVGADRLVVTYLPAPDSVVQSGDPIVGVSGRPLLFVSDASSLYRDLYRGLSGPDVAGLHSVLIQLGYLESGNSEGDVFGAVTEEAVARWYEQAGYDPAPAPDIAPSASVGEALQKLNEARDALSDARARSDWTAVAEAEALLEVAGRLLSAAEAAPVLSLPAAEVLALPYGSLVVVGSEQREGALVDQNLPLLEVRTNEVVVKASASRAQAARVAEGQTALIMIGDVTIEATVFDISSESDSIDSLVVTFDADVAQYPPGTPVLVEIEVASTPTAVTSVPASAIRTDADGTSFVTVLEGTEQRRVEVVLGVAIGGRVEVEGPLTAGLMVIVGRA